MKTTLFLLAMVINSSLFFQYQQAVRSSTQPGWNTVTGQAWNSF